MDYYRQLKVEPTATGAEIKRAYFRLVREFTPEKDPEAFMRIRKAYEELSDEDKRAAYDEQLSHLRDLPEDVSGAIMQARHLCSKGLDYDAADLLKVKMREHRRSRAASGALRYELANVWLDAGKIGKAVDIAENLVKDDPENKEYLQFAVYVCEERGWGSKADSYRTMLGQVSGDDEEGVLALYGKTDRPAAFFGQHADDIEAKGGKAPMLCLHILTRALSSAVPGNDGFRYEQLDLFSGIDGHPGEWEDLAFAAKKLAEHCAGAPAGKKEFVKHVIHNTILPDIYYSERFDIMPHISRAITNINAEDLFGTSGYKLVSLGHSALMAVQAGIQKTPVAYAVLTAFSQSRLLPKGEKLAIREEIPKLEIDILLSYGELKHGIKRLRDEYGELYEYAAAFFNAAGRQNEQKQYDEAMRRVPLLSNSEWRMDLAWLGEDDDLLIYREDSLAAAKAEPVRVTKTGRNEPCPCGSGKKYKKCCGR